MVEDTGSAISVWIWKDAKYFSLSPSEMGETLEILAPTTYPSNSSLA